MDGDDTRAPRYVLTAHRVGFRFGVPVIRPDALADAAPDAEHEPQRRRALLSASGAGASRVPFSKYAPVTPSSAGLAARSTT